MPLVCCGVLQSAAVCWKKRVNMPRCLQCVVVCCSVLRCVEVSCSVLQCVAVCCKMKEIYCDASGVLWYVAKCCSVLEKESKYAAMPAVCCSVLQCVALCCDVLK